MGSLILKKFIFYPAIDLKDGNCVRLVQGDLKRKTIFNDDPTGQAKIFESSGFEWLHIVDLDGAFSGKSVNEKSVKAIINETKLPIQLGGGLRDLKSISNWIDNGVSRVILGTVALNNPSLVKDACKHFPGKIAVGIDSRNGFVATEGWSKMSKIKDIDLAKKFEDCGVSVIIHTDIARDGLLGGPNVEESANLSKSVDIPIIISGGVGSNDDLKYAREKAKKMPNLNGIIIGRALYDGRVKINSLDSF